MTAIALATAPTAWAQQRDESSDEHSAFTQWLALAPRPAPRDCGPGVSDLAARNDWHGRAQAYDSACRMLLSVPDSSPQAFMMHAVEEWCRATAIDASKLADSAARSKGIVIDPSTQLQFFKAFAELKAAFASDRDDDWEWTGTPDELEEYLNLSVRMQRKTQ